MNQAAVVVPCHRVVRADGSQGGYRWGIERKRALQDTELRKRSAAGSTEDTENTEG
jgi:AraC family transcriptional regulator of adaptative response/methylated-DNA-[protein]-cysteine methyltransferase